MRMQRFMTVVVIGLLAAMTVPAQQNRAQRTRQAMSPEQRLEEMKERLSLTDKQMTQIKKLYEDEAQQVRKDRDKLGDDRQALREAMTKRREETDAKISAMLTDGQKKAYEQYKLEQSPAGRRMAALKERLKLTDEQTGKVMEIYAESHAAMRQARESSGDDRRAAFQAYRQAMEESEKKIEALLTAEQKKEFEAYRAERQERMRNRQPRQ